MWTRPWLRYLRHRQRQPVRIRSRSWLSLPRSIRFLGGPLDIMRQANTPHNIRHT
ncbi:hypothetical protein ACFFX0_21080 [Citricoccus parietis]|uniref:Uncharacterized protein n=1 Tax=Citricoccus parietis TaxID=592307 RepID=A0ABV5G3R7_9MICC